MYTLREKVWWFAISTRLTIILLQFFFNLIIPDHEADAFRSPRNPREKYSILDNAISVFFDGLVKWDAQYFIHIAKYGYTYENTLAFFPLYPIAIRYTALILRTVFFIPNESSFILAGVLISFLCFIKSAVTLYELSLIILRDSSLAYKSAILYCLSPASIFFTAIYSESMFALLTFWTILKSLECDPQVFLPLCLSTLVRSNGLINIGFPLYEWLKSFLNIAIPNFTSECKQYWSKWSLIFNLRHIYFSLCQISIVLILSLVPFCLLQLYNYSKFCMLQNSKAEMAPHVVHHAIENNFVLPGKGRAVWCDLTIPIAYSYIQDKYWNVGFLRYYELKQIPNFILALPILCIMSRAVIEFLRENKNQLPSLGLFSQFEEKRRGHYPKEMFPLVMHALFLTLFCIFFVHIQISTRLLSSASPLMYWYCACALSHRKESSKIEDSDNLKSRWRVFLINQEKYSVSDAIILVYFIGYIVVGTFMFSNFFPWT